MNDLAITKLGQNYNENRPLIPMDFTIAQNHIPTIDERFSGHRHTGHKFEIAFDDTQFHKIRVSFDFIPLSVDGSVAIEKAIEYLKSAKAYLDAYYPKINDPANVPV